MSEKEPKKTVFCHVCKQQTNLVIDSFSRYHLKPSHNITLKEYYDKFIKKENEDICNNANCRNKTLFTRFSKGYREYCSRQCRNKCKDSINKIKQSNLKNHGHESPFVAYKEKIKKTNLKKYGYANPFESKEMQDRCKDVIYTKYGVRNISESEDIKRKKRKTYGKNYWNTFLLKLKFKKIKPLFNCEHYISRNPFNFKCLRCGKKFIRNRTDPQEIFCGCLANRSKHEDEITDYLKSIGIKNIVSNKYFINDITKKRKYELDIYLPEYKLGIEFHGIFWHSDLYVDKNYHQDKYLYFKNKDIQVIQIFQNEWLNKEPIVKSLLKNKLDVSNKIYGRKCVVKEISSDEYRLFLEHNHIQGYALTKHRFGLFHNDELVSVMGFSKSRFSDDYSYEIIRFCNKLECSVIGGFSKLLKYFTLKTNPKTIVSYSDVRYFDGKGYLSNGFTQVHLSKPNYFYFKPNEMVLYNRFNFQKHKLKDKLKKFDPDKTEYQNMLENKYLRIFDAGNLVLVKNI